MVRYKVCLLGLIAAFGVALGMTSSPGSVSDNLSPSPAVVEITHPEIYSRVIALSDAHGMFDNLVALLASAGLMDSNQNWSGGSSLVLVVGDSIDKGPNTVDILDLWMKLIPQADAAGGKIIHLLGNHEAEFLSDPNDDKKAADFIAELQQRGIDLAEYTDPNRPHGAFLRSMPIAARVGKWLFAHAGLLPSGNFSDFSSTASSELASGNYGDSFFIGDNSILEAKDWWADDSLRSQLEANLAANDFFGVVFGHQPGALGVKGFDAISTDEKIIKIDSGMAPEAGSNPGALIVFTHPADMNLLAPAHVKSIVSGSSKLVSLKPEDRSHFDEGLGE